MRYYGQNRFGGGFDNTTVWSVWAKAHPVLGHDPTRTRKDNCGAWIQFSEYGNTNSPFGWEVDHIVPVAMGGSDLLVNLQPLQWQNNRHKGDSWPAWACAVKAS